MGAVGNFGQKIGRWFNQQEQKFRGVPAREEARAIAKAQADAQKEIIATQQREIEKREKAAREKEESISKKATEEFNARRRRRIGKASLIATSETGTSVLGTQDVLGSR